MKPKEKRRNGKERERATGTGGGGRRGEVVVQNPHAAKPDGKRERQLSFENANNQMGGEEEEEARKAKQFTSEHTHTHARTRICERGGEANERRADTDQTQKKRLHNGKREAGAREYRGAVCGMCEVREKR